MDCDKCSQSFSRFDVSMCPICHKHVCEKCGMSKGGKKFCSQYCAEYFYYYDGDEHPDDAG